MKSLCFLLLCALALSALRADASPDEELFLDVPGAKLITPRHAANPIPLLENVPSALLAVIGRFDFASNDLTIPQKFRGFQYDLHHDGIMEYFVLFPEGSGSGGAEYFVYAMLPDGWHQIYDFQGPLYLYPTKKGWPMLVSISRGGGGGGCWTKTYSIFTNGKYENKFCEHYDRGTITW